MVKRTFWTDRIEHSWKEKSVLWLSGVRRVGKTYLCQSLDGVEYFDCELPRVRQTMEDPQSFLDSLRGRRIVLDEIHRLNNPSELLKIAADHYPETHVLATGSSTLEASAKFRDTLTGRKRNLWLTPMCLADLHDFGQPDLTHRLFRGGMPPFFLAADLPERDFQEWLDTYWTKDVLELFRLERRGSFQKFVELIIAQSGGIFEATRFARPCEISRPTVSNYLKVLEATYVAHVIRPFNTYRPAEIVSAPRVYAFDTGFVCYFRGWHDLRPEDQGVLWEHFVLNEMMASLQTRDVLYWRDKQDNEIDFIWAPRGAHPTAIECKWRTSYFDARGLAAFRRHYPDGENIVAAHDVDRAYSRDLAGLRVHFENLNGLIGRLLGHTS